jgi:hypothetical protein
MRWQCGQIAETMSRSRDSSVAQPVLPAACGSGLAAPSWFTLVKQRAAVVQGGSPNRAR